MQRIHSVSDVTEKTIFITRALEDIVPLPSFLKFNTETKKAIMADISAIKFSTFSFTEESQRKDIELMLQQITWEASAFKSLLTNEKSKPHVINLLLYSKYLAMSLHDKKTYAMYAEKFKMVLQALQKTITIEELNLFLEKCATASASEKIMKAIALTYHEVISKDMLLSNFRSSEFIGHGIAYKIAFAKGEAEKVIVQDKEQNELETYSIKEIICLQNNTRDDALMGSILIPNYAEDAIPDVPVIYINWAGTHNQSTLLSDKERAPGEESYRRSEDQILQHITDAIKAMYDRYKKPIKIIISGHSLGGSLSQLCYHSCQRLLGKSINDEAVQIQVIEDEKIFLQELDANASEFKLSLHQQSLDKINLSCEMICELQIDTWNAAGVLKAVENHSNKLSSLLTKKGKIKQTANFGQVGGDAVQISGQGVILSDIDKNGAFINLFKAEPDTTRQYSTAIAPFGGGFAGAVIGPAFLGVSTVTGGVGLAALVLIAAMKTKVDAHTMKHFKESDQPNMHYVIYTSHNSDGSLNEDPETGYKKILETLCYKSTFVDSFMNMASKFGSSLRFVSDQTFQNNRFSTAINSAETAENFMKVLVTEMKSGTKGAEQRILQAVISKNAINVQDLQGKTLILHAIQNESYSLAIKLLEINDVDVNLLDTNKNHALLLLMINANNAFGLSTEGYQLGIKLLEKTFDLDATNIQGHSVKNIFATWRLSINSSARAFSEQLQQRINGIPVNTLVKKM